MGLICIPLTLLNYIEPFRFGSFLSKLICTFTALTHSLHFVHHLVNSPIIKFPAEWGLPLSAAILGSQSDSELLPGCLIYLWVLSTLYMLLLFSHQVVSDSFVTSWTVARQALLSRGFPRQEYWSGLPFPSPGVSSRLRDQTCVSCIGRWIFFFTTEPPGKPALFMVAGKFWMLINFVCMDQFWYCGFLNICLGQGKFLLPLDFLIITALITQSCLYLSRSPAASEPISPPQSSNGSFPQ